MKNRFSISFRFFSVLCLAFGVVGPRAVAEAPSGLSLQTYAGLTITGAVGTVYTVQYTADMAQSNDWRAAGIVQLPGSPYLWVDTTAPATGRRFYRAVQSEGPTNMVFIPPGTFRMGSPTNEVDRVAGEGPQTAVTISRGFWMGKYEVTQGDYVAVMGGNPSWFNGDRTAQGGANYGTDLSRPVEEVSWDGAMAYCAELTRLEREAGRIATNSVYRLPTEAEWEYACRGWTSSRFSYGDDPGYTNLTDYAWYSDNGGLTTHPVGRKLPNAWGLYDMHGNVWEWCQDWFGTYLGEIALDPQGPAAGMYHVVHGGRWNGDGGSCRSASRFRSTSSILQLHYVGFRVVLAPN